MTNIAALNFITRLATIAEVLVLTLEDLGLGLAVWAAEVCPNIAEATEEQIHDLSYCLCSIRENSHPLPAQATYELDLNDDETIEVVAEFGRDITIWTTNRHGERISITLPY